jgi:ParB family chromosome partitioning protein
MSVKSTSSAVRAIPLNRLKKSPKNVRKVPHTSEEIEALAANIHATRMLQFPVVEPEMKKGRPTGFYLVNIGEGRRLAQLLRVKRKQISATEPILCVLDPSADGVAISLAENLIRAPMHPCDQFEAFQQMRDAGKSVEEIAAQFNLKPDVVARRLKLAKVHPSFLAMYRAQELSLDQLMSLAITDDQERQQQVWKLAKHDHERTPQALKRALIGSGISVRAPLARFVGVDHYIRAGGGIEQDFFSEIEGDGYLKDVNNLARQKLEQRAAQMKKDGCAWVEVKPDLISSDLRRFGRVGTLLRPATPRESRTLKAIEKTRAQVQANIVEAEEEQDAERLQALRKRADELEERAKALENERRIPDPAQQSAAGAVVSIDSNGRLQVERNLLRPEDARRFARQQRGEPETTDKAEPAFSLRAHPDSLVRRLSAHRTLALQVELAQRPDIALVALTDRLAADTFYPSDEEPDAVLIQPQQVSLRAHASDLESSKAFQAIEAHHAKLRAKLPPHRAELFVWLLQQSQDTVLELLACCVASSVDAVQTREGASKADPLAQAVGLDMARWWTVTAESYLSSVPKARILAVVTEAVSVEAAAPLAKMSKASLAQAAEKRLSGTGWLPEPLRLP